MSEQTCNAEIGQNVTVKINFDYTKPDPYVGLGEDALIEQVIVLNDGGYPMGDIIDALSEKELDRLQELCIEHMGGM